MAELASPAAPPASALYRRALSLGMVNAVSYAVQFVLPVVLARFLTPEAFGEYRLIWLAIMTAMSFVPMEMHGVLYYFLPRCSAGTRRVYVRQTCLYLAAAGALAALAVSPLNPWLPAKLHGLESSHLLPVLVFAYAATLLLDTLPTIEERIRWQAAATLSLSLLRALLLSAAAWLTGDLQLMLWLILFTLALKGALLLTYIARHHGLRGTWFRRRRFHDQLAHAWPFGVADLLFQMRGQAGQWVAASLFPLGHFAAFSIAAMIGPLINLCRQSVNHVFLPSMSRLHASDDIAGTIRLNSHANVLVSTLAYPMLAFVFVFAEDLIRLVFTPAYEIAAPVMRVVIIGLLVLLIELSSLTLLYRDGHFVLRINALLAGLSAGISWLGALQFGLAGAALGSVAALLIDRSLTLRRIARHSGLPIRHLQDWPRLGRMLAAAATSALLARQATSLLPVNSWPSAKLLVAGVILTVCYGSLLRLSGDLPALGRIAPGEGKKP